MWSMIYFYLKVCQHIKVCDEINFDNILFDLAWDCWKLSVTKKCCTPDNFDMFFEHIFFVILDILKIFCSNKHQIITDLWTIKIQ
jgi:hypothetical protein